MKPSFLPKALLFKEWKEHRWWMLAAFLLLVYGPFANLFAVLQVSQTYPGTDIAARITFGLLTPILYHLQISPSNGVYPSLALYGIHGAPVVSSSGAVVAMGLMIALVTVERNRRTLWYTFSFPIRRVDALRVKIVMAIGTVAAAMLLNFLLLLITDLAAHQAYPVAVLLHWLGANLLIAVTLMAAGLVFAAMIPIGVVAGITALLLTSLPWAIGVSILRALPTDVGIKIVPMSASQSSFFSTPTTFSGRISMFLRSLSPESYFAGTSSTGMGVPEQPVTVLVHYGHFFNVGTVLWFLALIIGLGYLGFYAYGRMPIENTARFVVFPRLELWVWWLYLGGASLFIVNAFTANKTQISQTPFLLMEYWVAVWIAVGLVMTWVRHISRKRAVA